jgi:cytochrome c-type biogenesis protein CcmH/NrfF
MGLAVAIGGYGISQLDAVAKDVRQHDKDIATMEAKQTTHDEAARKVNEVAKDVAVIKSQVEDIKDDQAEIKNDIGEIKDLLRQGVIINKGGQ